MLENHFAKVLKEIRKEKNVSQEKLAELCDLHRTFISLLERGQRIPTISTLFKLSKALEIKPSEFVKRIENSINEVEEEYI